VDNIKLVAIFSDFLLYRNIPIGGIWDNHKNYYNINILFLFLLNNIFETIFQIKNNNYFF
jgi:hypothetical protein